MIKRIFIFLLIGTMVVALLPMGGMARERLQPRNPLLHGVASFILPGLGQFLNDEPSKALIHFLVAVAVPTVAVVATHLLHIPWYLRSAVISLASLGWHAYSAFEAAETAEEFNRKHRLVSSNAPFGRLTHPTGFSPSGKPISDLSSSVANSGLGSGDSVWFSGNPLNLSFDFSIMRAIEEDMRGAVIGGQ
ncbi:hypothetical protein LM599_04430 [Candidatus Acetothermia bacterium]|jgi:hypothetical protein|nr:hypothetical protein [Candidatus Acetothermia bacterium]MCI2427099.1 hypothetical protein [Candidatus Acetothermia bacterium]MCI2428233.1 hypothetical protein [Candidatus Acetothermia bacterium]